MKSYASMLVLLCFSLPASAKDVEILKPSTKYTHNYHSYTINEDASNVTVMDYTLMILTEDGIKYAKEQDISYSTSVEKCEIIEAYTEKANGKRIKVKKSNYQLEVNSGKDGNASPAYSDRTSLTIIFPDLAVGDSVHLSYKITQKEPLFPKHFSEMAAFDKSIINEDLRVKIDMPESMPVHYDVAQLKEEKVEQKAGRKIYQWSLQNINPMQDSSDTPSVYKFGMEPGYMLSTFSTYGAIAEAYGQRAKPKAAVTERIQKLADEISKDKTTPYEQAKALYEWTAKNISYAGNCIGVGAVVPRNIDFVLDNHMGDCKDHATVLEALLAAKQIASTQALINTGNMYDLPKVPVVSMVNHVINYIPSLNLFVDATAEGTPFGLLPDSEMGKPVLLVDGYQEGMRTPAPSHEDSKYVTKVKFTLAEDGSAKGNVESLLYGRPALFSNTKESLKKKNDFKSDKNKTEEYSKSMIKRLGFDSGSVKFEFDESPQNEDNAKFNTVFDVQGFIHAGTAGAFHINPLFATSYIAYEINSSKNRDEAEYDFVCKGGHVEEEYIFEFPKNIKALYGFRGLFNQNSQ